MTTPKFTPGPWNVAHTASFAEPFVTNSTGKMTVAQSIRGENGQQQEANASLIASAPALYAALEAVLADAEVLNNTVCHGQKHYDPNSFKEARAALALARGEKGGE